MEEMRRAGQIELGNRAAVTKATQVVRGNTADGSTSLSNVRLSNRKGAENIDYYRVHNDRQRLLDNRRTNSGGGSEDPNYIGGLGRNQSK